MTTAITPHSLTSAQYNVALYQLLLMLEEQGVISNKAYTDDRGIPTIGIGINMKFKLQITTILDKAFNIGPSPDRDDLVAALVIVANKTWAPNHIVIHNSAMPLAHRL